MDNTSPEVLSPPIQSTDAANEQPCAISANEESAVIPNKEDNLIPTIQTPAEVSISKPELKAEISELSAEAPIPSHETPNTESSITASISESSIETPISEPSSSINASAEIAKSEPIEAKPLTRTRNSTKNESSAADNSRNAQLRTRKRRISIEKQRLSSESDENNDALIESPVSQVSSNEEVGGKRIKMRPKVVKRSLRQSVEQKRNLKDTDWSSDDNEKPNAKRATGEVSQKTDDIQPSAEAAVLPNESTIKAEVFLPEKLEDTSNAVDETPVKEEEIKDEEQQSEEEEGEFSLFIIFVFIETNDLKEYFFIKHKNCSTAPASRRGRPGRRGRKPGPKPKAKPAEKVKTEDIKEEIKSEDVKVEKKEEANEVIPAKPEARRKKRSLMGLDMAEVDAIQAAADDTPVRQSRRIAQIKIREEADRRKAEEEALQKMKAAAEKKKKGGTSKAPSESEEENSESEAKLEKKKPRKKGNKDKPWQTDSDDSSEREEEEYEHEDVERLPPLRSDHEFSPESDIEDESQIVPTKRARTARKDKTERREEESEEEDVHACQKCSKSDHPEWILLCDKCDKGYHCSCLIPVLFVIPEGDWFCPPCQQDKLIDILEVKLLEFDNLIKQKEIEEAQRQRLLLTTISEANVLKDSKRDRQRAQALSGTGDSSDTSSTEESEAEEQRRPSNAERRTQPRPRQQRQRKLSESSEHNNSSDNSSDNEPIYKLRKRRQANVSYRFNEYDELINRAIKSEMDEVAGAGNLGRGKDISTIIEADKEEKRLKKLEKQQKERGEHEKDDNDSDDQPLKTKDDNSDGSDSEPIKPKAIKRAKNVGRKKKKLNSLDDDSDEADSSDDDFNTSSYSEDEEDDSSAGSESSVDSIVKKKRKGKSIYIVTYNSTIRPFIVWL